MRKILAYTIMEMIIVMLLSSVVFTIAFKSFEIISSHYITYKNNVDEIGDFSLLDRLISNNCLQSKKIERTTDGLDFIFETNRISYEFAPDYILRIQAGVLDTFFLESISYKLLFMNKEVLEENNLIDEISLEGKVKGELRNFNYFKQYAANELMLEENKKILSE
ncbi:MAG TPA: hypothetical protein VF691_02550 [Cytophagaceae bacterium]|jgi:hypothetical protein